MSETRANGEPQASLIREIKLRSGERIKNGLSSGSFSVAGRPRRMEGPVD
jgi:hypothetical protein